jgi:hypothetical protein
MDNYMFIYNFFPTVMTDRITCRILDQGVASDFMEPGLVTMNVYSKMAFSILGSNLLKMKHICPEACEDCSAKIQCHMHESQGDEACEMSKGIR